MNRPVDNLPVELPMSMQDTGFLSAKPIWPEGKEKEKNLFVGFRATFDVPENAPVVLRVAAATLYRAFVNGQFCGHGPARAAHGCFRVDQWDLTPHRQPGRNVVAIEVAGYNANGYYLLDQPSFLQAEVVTEGKVLASTGGQGAQFEAALLPERVQRVQRYSFQRQFTEVYRLLPGYARWRSDPGAPFASTACARLKDQQLLPRRVPKPRFAVRGPLRHISHGKLAIDLQVDDAWKDRSLVSIGPQLTGFPEAELETIPAIELQGVSTVETCQVDRPLCSDDTLQVPDKTFHILDFGTNLTGFIGAKVTCREPTRLHFAFDEMLSDGDVDWKRLGCVNIVTWELPAGTFTIESFEPYTLRYLKLMNVAGDCEVERLWIREYAYPDVWEAHFAASDRRLNVLFGAGRETLRQNAVDLFMDCPSRERAGWLCDSFFTARTAHVLSGDTLVERNFMENFLVPKGFADLPHGMLPMCYPADHRDGVFIPNWALWFVVQLEEYLARSNDRATVDALKPKVLALFDYFKPFKNRDGLLEKLDSWVFIEWSAANEFVQDVNYPTNMLYAGSLSAAGRLYNMPELIAEADAIREVVREQSFDGTFFVDNAVREDGQLTVTGNRSEVCQYFAFFFDVATPESHGDLWKTLTQRFGPGRKAFPEVHTANFFVGDMLRFELLSRYGRCQQILDESIDYLWHMAERTGTLWENREAHASCNHGFASHICYTLYRDILGAYLVDPVNKVIQLRFSDLHLEWCQGRIPVPGGAIDLQWWQDGETRHYRLHHPAGYAVEVDNLSTMELVRER